MASNRVRIYIDGDSAGIQRATRSAESSLSRLHASAQKSLGGATSVAAGFGLAMGANGLLGTVQESVAAFREAEQSTARMSAQLKVLGQNTSSVKQQIDQAIQSQSKFGAFDDEDLQDSFTRLLRSTKDVNTALKLNRTVMDIARGTGKDLASVANAVARAYDGNGTALQRMGVHLEKGAKGMDAIRAAQAQFHGQAAEFAKTDAADAERASIAWENAQESIGKGASAAFAELAQGATTASDALGGVVEQLGGFQGVAVGGGVWAGIKFLGGGFVSAAQGIAQMRREANLLQRVKLGQFDAFLKTPGGAVKIDTKATAASIRRAYADIGSTLTSAQARAISQVERIAVPPSTFGRFTAAARTAGSQVVNLLGGPLGAAAVAGGLLAVGAAAWVSSLQSVEDKARAVGDAIQHAIDLQTSLADAKLGLEQATMDAQTAQRGRRQAAATQRQAQSRYDSVVAGYAQGPSGMLTQDLAQLPQVVAARRKLTEATRASTRADLEARQAALRVREARDRVKQGERDQADAADTLAQKVRTLAKDADEAAQVDMQDYRQRAHTAGILDAAFDKNAASAKHFAEAMRNDVIVNGKHMTEQAQASELALAHMADALHRVPNKTETKIISDAVAKGEDVNKLIDNLSRVPESTTANVDTNAPDATAQIAALKANLDALHDRDITITTHYVTKGATGDVATRNAGGAFVGGPRGAGDIIPAWLKPGEIVMNEPQQRLADAGYSVADALRMTGAPTIGGAWHGYASGGKSAIDRWQERLDASRNAFETDWALLDMQLARAEGTRSPADDRRVRDHQVALLNRRVAGLRRLLRERVPPSLRGDIYSEIAQHVREVRDLTTPQPAAPPPSSGDWAAERTYGRGVQAGLGRLSQFIFGGASDIGSGRGALRVNLAVDRLVLSSAPANVGAVAGAANAGNALFNARRMYSPRMRIG